MATFERKALQDRNVIVDAGFVFLSNTFRNPDDISAFLFFQFEIRIKDTIMELLQESVHIQFDFVLKETIFERFVLAAGLCIEENTIFGKHFGNITNLFIVVGLRERCQTVWMESTTGGIELCPVLLRQFSAKRVDCDDER